MSTPAQREAAKRQEKLDAIEEHVSEGTLSIRQMTEEEGLPPQRLAANGFGEFQPIDTSGTPEGRARNRRIEIKLTER